MIIFVFVIFEVPLTITTVVMLSQSMTIVAHDWK